MTLSERIAVLHKLGEHLSGPDDYLEAVMARAKYHNAWFTIENQQAAISAIKNQFLKEGKLKAWTANYTFGNEKSQKVIGVVLTGNLPLEGFHDVLAVFISGHKAIIKLSEKDKYLLPYLVKLLERFDKRTTQYFEISENLSGFEAIIATGGNNSAKYFEAYFGQYPNIIRKNRFGIAVLTGTETVKELHELGKDVFRYYGLGNRNVSKIYVPKGYDFNPLLEALHEYRQVVLNTKYKNNFDHNYSILILNKEPYLANGCIILKENGSLQSPIGCLHYSFYDSKDSLASELASKSNEIQCVVSKEEIPGINAIPFGQAQEPGLLDYSDGVDTLNFLTNLQ